MKKQQELEHETDGIQADEIYLYDSFLLKIFENPIKPANNQAINEQNNFSKPDLIKEQQKTLRFLRYEKAVKEERCCR